MTRIMSNSSSAAKTLDPLDHYGYTAERNAAQLAQEEAERQRQLNEAAAAEEARKAAEEQRRINAVNSVNSLYDSSGRQQGYDSVRDSSLKFAMDEIARNKADAERMARFGLARSGLYGGSADLSTSNDIADSYSRSIIQANQLADNKVASLRSQDEAMRADLISRINAGLDADSALSTANQSMMNYRNEALTAPQSALLNNLFSGIGNAFSSYQYGKAAANPYGALAETSPVNSVGLASSYKGRITS
ncbi:hypothetical protein BWD09_06995 [Neisseria dentiae]|uniref:Uncharacterized protein n=3 Tax=Neisseria dentiae TaxID=194197 RepID=A0A1X3D9Q1_9NEIS|nr:hypothetical protein BWD09_06995 [Neisseria dentiae]